MMEAKKSLGQVAFERHFAGTKNWHEHSYTHDHWETLASAVAAHAAIDADKHIGLRDYFAAKAMQALLASESWRDAFERSAAEHGDTDDRIYWTGTAVQAFFMADQMLKAREA